MRRRCSGSGRARRSRRSPMTWASTAKRCAAGSGSTTSDAARQAVRRSGAGRSRPARSRRRTRRCAGGSGSWRKSGTSCARRPGISPGRRAGDPLPVRRRPPGALRREAVVPARRGRPLEFLLLESDCARTGGARSRGRCSGRADPGGVGQARRHLRRAEDHRRAARRRTADQP